MATIEKSIEVDAPLASAYGQWAQLEELPRFITGVVEVRRLDETLTHWVAEVHGRRHEWDAQIVEQKPERVIGWRAVDGTRNGCRVTFTPVNGQTRVSVLMVYEPTASTGSPGPAIRGPVPRLDERSVEEDLERFKELVESRHAGDRGWRAPIEPERLVEDDGTVL